MGRGFNEEGVSRWRYLGEAWPAQQGTQENGFLRKFYFKRSGRSDGYQGVLRQREGNYSQKDSSGPIIKVHLLDVRYYRGEVKL